MKIASIAEIKSKLSEYIKESQKGAVVITKNGRPAAVLIAVSDDDQLEQIIFSQSRMLKNILDKSEKNISSTSAFAQFHVRTPSTGSKKLLGFRPLLEVNQKGKAGGVVYECAEEHHASAAGSDDNVPVFGDRI